MTPAKVPPWCAYMPGLVLHATAIPGTCVGRLAWRIRALRSRVWSTIAVPSLTSPLPSWKAELGLSGSKADGCVYADLPWSEEDRPEYASDATTSEQIAQDHKAATTWYRTFKKAKKNEASESESVPVDHDVTAHVQPPQGEPCQDWQTRGCSTMHDVLHSAAMHPQSTKADTGLRKRSIVHARDPV